MAQKPRGRAGKATGTTGISPRDRAIDAFLRLLEDHSFHEIGLSEIANGAGLSLAELRALFPGKYAIVSAFSERIDGEVLGGEAPEGETGRDRLFDIMMRRFEALGPHKAAVRALAQAGTRDPCLAGLLHRNSLRSLQWLKAAADVHRSGLVGLLAGEGLALVQAETFRVWLNDEDPGLARTMAALDKGLRRGEKALGFVDTLCSRLRPFAERAEPKPQAAG